MTALLLGLVTASAKSSFDSMDSDVRNAAADCLALDLTLARYGPETREIRQALSHALRKRLEITWSQDSTARLDQSDLTYDTEQLIDRMDRIDRLLPQNDEQRLLKTRAMDLAESLLNTRWIIISELHRSIPTPFLAMLVFWLTITFTSFGLFAPRNTTVILVYLVSALSVGAAIFLILELEGPFDGLIRISPEPLQNVYSRIYK